jgi:hypothetical protein
LEDFLHLEGCRHVSVRALVHGGYGDLKRWIASNYFFSHFRLGIVQFGQEVNALHVWQANVNQREVEERVFAFLYAHFGCFCFFNNVTFIFKNRLQHFLDVLIIINYKNSSSFDHTFLPQLDLEMNGTWR